MSTVSLPSDFLDFSSVLGVDRLLVQGPGGNTSLKLGNSLYIKASGMELADAKIKEIFVEVDLAAARAEIDGNGDGSCIEAVVDKSRGLRPSIETTFHALLPQKFVFHYHSVNSLVYSSSAQGRTLLDQELLGMDWVAIPYRKPGLELTLNIRETMKSGLHQIYILENHGVIIGSDSVNEAIDLVRTLELRLDQTTTSSTNLGIQNTIPDVDGWTATPRFGTLAHNPRIRERATSGSYYPDHVVFLGPALPEVTIDELSQIKELQTSFPAIILEDKGVLLKNNINPSQVSMLQCLLDFLERVPEDWNLIPIGSGAEKELLNWDAEKYRQKLSGAFNGPN